MIHESNMTHRSQVEIARIETVVINKPLESRQEVQQ